MDLRDMVNAVISQLKREDFFEGMGWSPAPRNITHAPFNILYTIPRTSSKNIELEKQKEYETMISEATLKTRPAVVLIVIEKKVCLLRRITTYY